jgi:hypothetical protein
MPTISRFYGIIITINLIQKEHNPPHFHAFYADYEALINIKTLEIMEGSLSNTALYLVKQWAKFYQKELLEIWETQKFKKLPNLE